jgi:polyferredoxin
MADFYRKTLVKKTRSDHSCHGCQSKIPKGSKALYIVGVYEGYFGACHMCLTCQDYIDKYPEVTRDGYCEGDIGDARREEALKNES